MLYGYQWWADGSTFGGRKFSWIAGIGLGGQRIYTAPADDLVVVITAGLYNATLEDQNRIIPSIFYRYVPAAIRR